MDVYDIATSIGRDCQQIIEEHGVETLQRLMPKVVSVLEHLENIRQKRDNDFRTILALNTQVESLLSEKDMQLEERQSFDFLLEQMERSFHRESTDLLAQVSMLEEENKRLSDAVHSSTQYSNDSSTKMDEISMYLNSNTDQQTSQRKSAVGVGAYLKAIVEGKRVPMIPKSQSQQPKTQLNDTMSLSSSSSSSLSCLLTETMERLNICEENNRVADMHLIGKLKEATINNSNQIRALRKKRLQVAADIDAAEDEVYRLARNQGRLLATYESDQNASYLTLKEHKVKIIQELFDLEQEINILQCENVTTPECDELRLLKKFSFDKTVTLSINDKAFSNLNTLYQKRNELKSSITQIEEQIRILKEKQQKYPIADENELLYGPMPEEPFEKLHPNEKTSTLDLLRKLMNHFKTS